jgi:integrase
MARLRHADDGGYVFQGGKLGRSLSNMALLMTLRRMERSHLTAHGFRSTFRDWAAEQTSAQHEVAEACLAHAPTSAVVAAYRRGDLLQKRRALLQAWADYCMAPAAVAGSVISIRKTAG